MWQWVYRTGRRTDRRTDTSPCTTAVFFFCQVAKDTYSYYVTVVWSCNVALWNISLYLVEWGTCVVIRLSDRHIPAMHSQVIHSHWFGSPIMHLWYYLQRRNSARAKFHPLPPPRHSHRGRGKELAQYPRIQTAVWMGLLTCLSLSTIISSCTLQSPAHPLHNVSIRQWCHFESFSFIEGDSLPKSV